MKRFLVIIVSLVLFLPISVSSTVSAKENVSNKNIINIADISGDVEIYKYDADEFIEVIQNDTNIDNKTKSNLINKIENLKIQRLAYDYWTIYQNCEVSDTYTCRPYFYTYSSFATGGYPNSIEKVLYANIDRNDNGVSKQFDGTLYYHLEASNKLYWDLNGDFYNNGTTTVSGGVEIKPNEKTTVSFSVSHTTNYYKYCHKSGRLTF